MISDASVRSIANKLNPSVGTWQVLDGASVEAGEQASSRSQYAGRLTLDNLLERIAPARLENLRELDLTGMALKDLADVLVKEEHSLSALQSLRLDQNELTEVSLLTLLICTPHHEARWYEVIQSMCSFLCHCYAGSFIPGLPCTYLLKALNCTSHELW